MKRIPTALTAMGATALLTFSASPVANAKVESRVVATQCVRALSWAGSNYAAGGTPWWPRGTVDHCVSKVQIDDLDPSADYYVVGMVSEYTLTDGRSDFGARGQHTVTSSMDSSVIRSSCGPLFGDSGMSDPFSNDCNGDPIAPDSDGPNWAQWTVSRVGGAEVYETAYAQKVPQGTVPTFSAVFTRPAWGHWKAGGSYTNDEAYLSLYLEI